MHVRLACEINCHACRAAQVPPARDTICYACVFDVQTSLRAHALEAREPLEVAL